MSYIKSIATMEGLQEWLEQYTIQSKVVIVPDHAIGNELLNTLVQKGKNYINIYFKTPKDIVCEIGLRINKKDKCKIVGKEYAVYQLMHSLDTCRNQFLYFKDISITYELAEIFYELFMEFKRNGIQQIPHESCEVDVVIKSKLNDINLVFEHYRQSLEKDNVMDEGDVYLAAGQYIPDKRLKQIQVIQWGEQHLTTFEKKKICEFYEYEGFHYEDFDTENTQATLQIQSREGFKAYGEYNELLEVIRIIKRDKIPFEEVMIYHTDSSIYPYIIKNISMRLNIPITMGQGISIKLATPYKVITLLHEWIKSNYKVSYFEQLLVMLDVSKILYASSDKEALCLPSKKNIISRKERKRVVTKISIKSGEYIPYFSKNMFNSLNIGWGRARYSECIANYQEEDRRLSSIKKVVDYFLVELPEAITYKQLAKVIIEIMTYIKVPFIPHISKDDKEKQQLLKEARGNYKMAKDAIIEYLNILGEVEEEIKLEEGLEHIIEAINGLTIGAKGAMPGYIHFTHYAKGRENNRKYHFIVGLDSERMPKIKAENPVLLDKEKEYLQSQGIDLLTIKEEYQIALRQLDTLIKHIEGEKLVISYSCYDNVQLQEMRPSHAYKKYRKILKIEEDKDVKIAYPLDSTSCLSYIEKSFYNHERNKDWTTELNSDIEAEYSCINNLRNKMLLEAGKELSIFEGRIKEENSSLIAPMWVKTKEDIAVDVSASRLQTFAICPYKYFLAYVLGIRKIEENEYKFNQWLTPADLGSLYHEVFETFYKQVPRSDFESLKSNASLSQEQKDAIKEAWKQKMGTQIEQTISIWRNKVPTPSSYIQKVQEEEIKKFCNRFVEIEWEYWQQGENVSAEAFEQAFGSVEKDNTKCVAIKLGDESYLKVNGKIDRIDLLADGTYRIIDYKSGKKDKYDNKLKRGDTAPKLVLKAGRNLQHIIYAMAYEEMEEQVKKVREASFYFIKEELKEENEQGVKRQQIEVSVGVDEQSSERVEGVKVLNIIKGMMEKGYFIRNCNLEKQDQKGIVEDCSYCEYQSVCADMSVRRILKEKCNEGNEVAFYGN